MNATTITVTLFGDDTAFDRRRRFRDVVSDALAQARLGTYVGGGSMITSDPNYNIEFDVSDEAQGLSVIREALRRAGVGHDTELYVTEARRYSVYDAA